MAESERIDKGGWIYLNPFGKVNISEKIYEGKFYSLYSGAISNELTSTTYEDVDICLKTVSDPINCEELYHSFLRHSYNISGIHYRINNELVKPDFSKEELITLLGNMLLIEAELIDKASQYWGHKVLGIGFTSDFTKIDKERSSLTQFRPVLVMPYYKNAIPLSKVPVSEKASLFRRMIPSLFEVLCHSYHGDLSESNLLIEKDRLTFRIIDPGVHIANIFPIRNTFCSVHESESFFLTNPNNYPFIAPFQDVYDRVFENESIFRESTDLVVHKFRWAPLGNNFPISGARKTETRPQPYFSDLLAIGFMYYRMLTGEDLLYDEETQLEEPFWLREETGSDCGVSVPPNLDGLLYSDYILRKLKNDKISSTDKTFLDKLFHLSINSKEHLLQLMSS